LEAIDYLSEARQEPIQDQYVIEISHDVQVDDFLATIDDLNILVVDVIPDLNRIIVRTDDTMVASLPNSAIVSTEPDYYASALFSVPPADPYYPLQWNLELIGAPDAWIDLSASITPIQVAVIDSGMCFDHPDMQGTYTGFQWDYVDKDNYPQDEFDHGCGVTGVIASQNNDIGMIGIAPFAEIMPLRVLDKNGIGTYSNIAQAIVDATNQGAQIINLSLGGINDSSTLHSAIDYALVNNVYVVAATGNSGQATPLYPAIYDGVIAVGSVNSDSAISTFSNRGEDSLAPGEAILIPTVDNEYNYLSGTSLAAPHVVGVIALDLALGYDPIIGSGVIRAKSAHLTSTIITEVSPDIPLPQDDIAPQLTNRWIVRLAEDTNADAVAQSLGYINLGQVGDLPSYYVFSVIDSNTSTAQSQLTVNALSTSPNIIEFSQEVLKVREKRQLPTDPLTSDQWHLQNTGQTSGTVGEDIDVVGAWNDGITGQGVTIAIVDDGLQYTHPDLAPQYNASGSFDYNSSDPNSVLDSDNDPAPDSTDEHGTSVGGVAAADNDGTTCGVGVAYDANLSGLRLIAHSTVESQEVAALNYEMQINDIYNNSWGPSDSGAFYEDLGSATVAALSNGVNNGRDGKGVIYVFAAGNGLIYDDSSNYDGFASSHYTIAVGATDHTGDLASTYIEDGFGGYIEDAFGDPISFYYSEGGANVFVNAPSGHQPGIVTTDLLGSDGYNNASGYSNDCTDDFGGTSSAAPTVSGVIALMLEANPNLTWRDVKYILAETADKNDPTDPSWQTNAASYETNYYYGFGRVNASAAVALAKTWTNVTPEITAGPYTPFSSPSIAIPDGSGTRSGPSLTNPSYGTSASKNIGTQAEQIQFVETVEVEIDVTHDSLGDLAFALESPEGTFSTLSLPRRFDTSSGNITLEMSSKDFWGETALGNWKLYVYDGYSGQTGTLNDWSMTVYGTRGTYLVNTTADGTIGCDAAYCSLRGAIQFANSYASDTGNQGLVIVPAGTYTLSRTGTESWSTHDLDITENIRIVGAGRDQTIIDADGIDRVFDISAPAIIESLSITGGIAPNGEDGGGIRVTNGSQTAPVHTTLRLFDLGIYGNSTTGDGGGIAADSLEYFTKLVFSEIYQNSATNGGGINQINAQVDMREVYIHDNQVTANGGGIYLGVCLRNVQRGATF
jgi:CSLREA domain-containing protein